MTRHIDAAEAVCEDNNRLHKCRICLFPIASGVQVYEILGLWADGVDKQGTIVQREGRNTESVGAVCGVAQTGQLNAFTGSPLGQQHPHPFEVHEQGAARMMDVIRTAGPQQFFGRRTPIIESHNRPLFTVRKRYRPACPVTICNVRGLTPPAGLPPRYRGRRRLAGR